PYDMAGWTLPFQMGVRADMINTTFAAEVEEVRLKPDTPGTVASGPSRTNDRRNNLSVKTAMDALKRGERVAMTPMLFNPAVVAGELPRRLHLPRVGVYKSFLASMDEGWARYVLEQFDVPFTSVENKEVRAGNLRSRFDTIVLPNQDADAIVNGHAPGAMPPEYAGGIGLDGVAALRAFVEA